MPRRGAMVGSAVFEVVLPPEPLALYRCGEVYVKALGEQQHMSEDVRQLGPGAVPPQGHSNRAKEELFTGWIEPPTWRF